MPYSTRALLKPNLATKPHKLLLTLNSHPPPYATPSAPYTSHLPPHTLLVLHSTLAAPTHSSTPPSPLQNYTRRCKPSNATPRQDMTTSQTPSYVTSMRRPSNTLSNSSTNIGLTTPSPHLETLQHHPHPQTWEAPLHTQPSPYLPYLLSRQTSRTRPAESHPCAP